MASIHAACGWHGLNDMDVDVDVKAAHRAPKPHDFLWLSDGNVILATDSLLFKVHKSVLSMQSAYFKIMFEVPIVNDAKARRNLSGTTRELCDGLPMINLSGDKGTDVAHLLSAAYERQYYYRDNDDTPLEIITALLVLSTKYSFEHIRKDVIQQISRHYPMTMDAYISLDDDKASMFGEIRENCHYPLLKALFAAKVDPLLPVLYYACADYDIDSVIDWWNVLDPTCLQTLFKGKDMLTCAMGELIAKLPDDFHEGGGMVCPTNQSCYAKGRLIGLVNFLQLTDLKDIEGHKVVKACLRKACGSCTNVLAGWINIKRQKIWDEIPSYFGLSGWDELKQKLEDICRP